MDLDQAKQWGPWRAETGEEEVTCDLGFGRQAGYVEVGLDGCH